MIWVAGYSGCHPNGILSQNVRLPEGLILQSGLQEADARGIPGILMRIEIEGVGM